MMRVMLAIKTNKVLLSPLQPCLCHLLTPRCQAWRTLGRRLGGADPVPALGQGVRVAAQTLPQRQCPTSLTGPVSAVVPRWGCSLLGSCRWWRLLQQQLPAGLWS